MITLNLLHKYFEWLKTESNLRLFFTKNIQPETKSDYSPGTLVGFFPSSTLYFRFKTNGEERMFWGFSLPPKFTEGDPLTFPFFSSFEDEFVKALETFRFDPYYMFQTIPQTYEDMFIAFNLNSPTFDALSHNLQFPPDTTMYFLSSFFSGSRKSDLEKINSFFLTMNIHELSVSQTAGEVVCTFIYENTPCTLTLEWSTNISFVDTSEDQYQELVEDPTFLKTISARVDKALKLSQEVPE